MTRRRTPLLALAALLAAAPAARAQPAVDAATHDGRQGQTRVVAPRLEAEVTIDGELSEPAWAQAARLTGFSQYAPADDRAAEDATEVLLWYSPTALHVGVRAHEAHGPVHATLADRDHIQADDYVEILLDTFRNGRQANVFAVNPLGVQADGVLNETGAVVSASGFSGATVTRELPTLAPDFTFDSRGRVTDTGYEVEIRIPFKSLRYQSDDVQSWGFQVIRHVQHSGYEDVWAPARRAGASFLGQAGELAELTDLRRGLVLDLNPELTLRANGAEELDGEWGYETDSPDIGGNLRWGVTTDLTLNATVRPDFSQVEGDVGQLVFDPRQAISFPEKRPFFLDAIEQFDVPNRLIFTRRIVQPSAAVKLTGKYAGTDVAVLSAIDDPGDDDHPTFNVLRAQRNLGDGGSRIGMVFTDRRAEAVDNTVAGIDGRIVWRADWSSRLQYAHSWTRGATDVDAPLWEAGLVKSGRRFGLRFSARGIHEDFRALSGFISRPGIVNASVAPRWTVYGAEGAFVESFTSEIRGDFTWLYDDFVNGENSQDEKLHFNFNSTLRGGWRAGVSLLVETFGYEPALYEDYALEIPLAGGPVGATDTVPFVGQPEIDNLDWVVSVATPEWRKFSGSVFALWGHDENFPEWASGDIWWLTLEADWRPTDRLRVGGLYQLQQVNRRTDGSLVDRGRIPRLKVEYQVTRAIFVRLVGQYTSLETDALRDDSRTNAPILIRDETGTYVRTVARSSGQLRTDALFAYRPTPGTTVFVGYGSTAIEPGALRFDDLERSDDAFFVKISYLHRM